MRPSNRNPTPQKNNCIKKRSTKRINKREPHRRPTFTQIMNGNKSRIKKSSKNTKKKHKLTENKKNNTKLKTIHYKNSMVAPQTFKRNILRSQKNNKKKNKQTKQKSKNNTILKKKNQRRTQTKNTQKNKIRKTRKT